MWAIKTTITSDQSLIQIRDWINFLKNQEILEIMKITSFLYFNTLKGKEKIRKSEKYHTPYNHCLPCSIAWLLLLYSFVLHGKLGLKCCWCHYTLVSAIIVPKNLASIKNIKVQSIIVTDLWQESSKFKLVNV